MGKDTKIDFLLQILRTLLGIKDLAHFSHAAILFLLIKRNCPRMPEWHQSDSCLGHVRAPESTKKPCSASSSCLIHDTPRLCQCMEWPDLIHVR